MNQWEAKQSFKICDLDLNYLIAPVDQVVKVIKSYIFRQHQENLDYHFYKLMTNDDWACLI